jgi:sec-independent protein translocase protein TatA
MGLSGSHILIALLVFVLLFGSGKISALMGDVAEGIKSFKKGFTEEREDEVKPEPAVIDHEGSKATGGRKVRGTGRWAKSSPARAENHVRPRLV